MPDKGMGRVSDIALLTHIKAIHDETGVPAGGFGSGASYGRRCTEARSIA